MIVDGRAQLDLLDLDDLLLLARLGGFFLHFVFVFAVIHQLAHGRFGIGRNFDQIEAGFFGKKDSVARGHDAAHFALGIDNANLASRDAAIDAGAVIFFTTWRFVRATAGSWRRRDGMAP